MKKLRDIGKMLLFLIVFCAGVLAADTVCVKFALHGIAKGVVIAIGTLPALCLYWVWHESSRRKTQAVWHWLRRPVPLTTWIWRAVGLVIMVAGLVLGVGNITGQYVTFSYAGSMTFVIGWLLIYFLG